MKNYIVQKNYEKAISICNLDYNHPNLIKSLLEESPKWFKEYNWTLYQYFVTGLFCCMLNSQQPQMLFDIFAQNIIEHGMKEDEKTRSTMYTNYLDAIRKVEGGVFILHCIHGLLIDDKQKFEKYRKCCEIFWDRQEKLCEYFHKETQNESIARDSVIKNDES